MNQTSNSTELSENLKKVADMIGGLESLATKMDISEAQLRRYIKGVSQPTLEPLLKAATAANMSLDALVNGSSIKSETANEQDDGWVDVPLYDIKAGARNWAVSEQPNIRTYLKFRRPSLLRKRLDIEQLCAVQAVGDSMADLICDGDTLLVDQTQCTPAGDIYVVHLGDVLLARRLMPLSDGSIQIISNNPIYPVEVVARMQTEQLAVLGRVVWFGRWL